MRKMNLIILTMAASAGCSLWQPSFAQTVQGWQNAEQNEINQAQSVGALNQRQAARLDSQEAAINAQRQQDLMQNGGHLTNYERSQLGSELNQVNNHINRDEFHDARRRGHHGQWQNGMQGQFPGGMPGQFANGVQPGYPGYRPNGYVPNANGFVPPNPAGGYVPNANRYVPNANGYVPNANGYMPNANGYAPNGYAPNPGGYNQNGNGQRAGGMLNKLEQMIGGQNNGRTF